MSEKNEGVEALGAELVEEGQDYDESVQIAARLADQRGLVTVHSTNDTEVLAGAGTLALEMLEQELGLDVLVVAIGGGSQAVGALTVARELRPSLEVIGAQAEGASAAHDSWHARERRTTRSAETFADGIATRATYDFTWPTLRDGLAGFVTVSDAEIADAIRLLLRTTHNLAEGAGAAGLAGLLKIRDRLVGRRVGIILSGGNLDVPTLKRILA